MSKFTISFNIGYDVPSVASGVLNGFPMLYQFVTIREFTEFIRDNSLAFADWAIQHNVMKSSIVLYVNITRFYIECDEEWIYESFFRIKCKNIREYIPLLSMGDNEIQSLLKSKSRDEKINDVLDPT